MASRIERYLGALPGGLSAYPECSVKAAVTRQFYESYGSPVLPDDAPLVVRQLASEPPPVSVFVPEVHARALYYAMADVLGWTDEELVAKSRKSNAALLAGPLYRVLFAFVSPDRLLRNAGARWLAFHRGTALEIETHDATSCRLALTGPAHITDELLARMHATSLDAALGAAGAKDVVTTVPRVTPTRAEVHVTWR